MEQEQRQQSPLDNIGLYGFLDLMRRNVPMYIGSLSVKDLQFFLLGWGECCGQTGRSPTDEEKEFFSGFQKFVEKKYRGCGAYGWDSCITRRVGGDGEVAVAEFYRLFDLFRDEKRKEKAREERRRKKEAKAAEGEGNSPKS